VSVIFYCINWWCVKPRVSNILLH